MSAPIECLHVCIHTMGCVTVNVVQDMSGGFQCELNDAAISTVTQNSVSNTEGNVYYELDIIHCGQ